MMTVPAHLSSFLVRDARTTNKLGAREWLEATRRAVRIKRYAKRTETAYLGWLARFLRFRARRHDLDEIESLKQFLTHLASNRLVSASTQKQALSAIRFAFAHGLERPLPWLDGFATVFRPARLPTVLSVPEVGAVISQLSGAKRLVGMLLYGSGLRLLEALSLRVKDADFERNTLTYGVGKETRIASRCSRRYSMRLYVNIWSG